MSLLASYFAPYARLYFTHSLRLPACLHRPTEKIIGGGLLLLKVAPTTLVQIPLQHLRGRSAFLPQFKL